MKLTTKQKYIIGALLVGAVVALALVTLSGDPAPEAVIEATVEEE